MSVCDNNPSGGTTKEWCLLDQNQRSFPENTRLGVHSEPTTAQKPETKVPSNDQRSAATASIRLPIDFFSRDKIRVIRGQKDGNQTILLYILLVCMAAKANRHGELALSDEIPYDDNIIASLAQMEQKQVQNALAELMKYGLIRQLDDIYTVVNFDSMADAERKRCKESGRKVERG